MCNRHSQTTTVDRDGCLRSVITAQAKIFAALKLLYIDSRIHAGPCALKINFRFCRQGPYLRIDFADLCLIFAYSARIW